MNLEINKQSTKLEAIFYFLKVALPRGFSQPKSTDGVLNEFLTRLSNESYLIALA